MINKEGTGLKKGNMKRMGSMGRLECRALSDVHRVAISL